MPDYSKTHKLVDLSGAEISPGDTVQDFRGDLLVFDSISRIPGSVNGVDHSNGKVVMCTEEGTFVGEYYPSVINARIEPRT